MVLSGGVSKEKLTGMSEDVRNKNVNCKRFPYTENSFTKRNEVWEVKLFGYDFSSIWF